MFVPITLVTDRTQSVCDAPNSNVGGQGIRDRCRTVEVGMDLVVYGTPYINIKYGGYHLNKAHVRLFVSTKAALA